MRSQIIYACIAALIVMIVNIMYMNKIYHWFTESGAHIKLYALIYVIFTGIGIYLAHNDNAFGFFMNLLSIIVIVDVLAIMFV